MSGPTVLPPQCSTMPDIKVNLNRTRLRPSCLLLGFRLRFAIDQQAYFGSVGDECGYGCLQNKDGVDSISGNLVVVKRIGDVPLDPHPHRRASCRYAPSMHVSSERRTLPR